MMTNQTENVAIISLLPFLTMLDADALMGSFCGAILYVTSSPESSIFKRLLYMIVAFFCGYSFAPYLAHKFGITHTGVSAFLISALGIYIFTKVVDIINSATLEDILRGRK